MRRIRGSQKTILIKILRSPTSRVDVLCRLLDQDDRDVTDDEHECICEPDDRDWDVGRVHGARECEEVQEGQEV